MTVGELRKALEPFPDEMLVYVEDDYSEGRGRGQYLVVGAFIGENQKSETCVLISDARSTKS